MRLHCHFFYFGENQRRQNRPSYALKVLLCFGKTAMSIDLNDLRNLPVSEKLRIVELLWDDIGASDEPIVLQPWQRDETQRRSAEMKADPSIAINRTELWRRVNG